MWNWCQVKTTDPHQWEVNIGLGNVARQQAITWTNIDSDLWHHMASPGHNELTHLSLELHIFVIKSSQHQAII